MFAVDRCHRKVLEAGSAVGRFMTKETMGLAGSDRSQWDAALHLVLIE